MVFIMVIVRTSNNDCYTTMPVKYDLPNQEDPFVLYYSEEFYSKSEAYKRELFFKSFEGRKWLYEKKIL